MVQKKNIDLEIILVLLSGEKHLREISRLLKIPHSTILRKLKDLVKRNILDYEVQGRNKIFFIKDNLKSKNYIFNAEGHKLVKLLESYSYLNIILREIVDKSSQELVILFGSYANFSANKNSDIDVYVESRDRKIKSTLEKINSKINVKLGDFDKNSLLIKEIIKNHVILKGVEKFYEKIID